MIRYPGSKDKIAKKILRFFPTEVTEPLWQSDGLDYREPFFGGGAVGFALLRLIRRSSTVWLNDKDYGMACLWRSVYERPDELVEMIRSFTPSTDSFYLFKEEDGRTDMDPVVTGFRKLALHQTSYSGLGAMAGGPIGGRKQSGEFNVSCRWNAARHALGVMKRHRLMRRFSSVKITSGDFGKCIEGATEKTFIYADPPYYEKGPELYKHAMSAADHERLAFLLKSSPSHWVLSYDDDPRVRDLYDDWTQIDSVEMTYSIGVSKTSRRKNSEIIISPRPRRRSSTLPRRARGAGAGGCR